MLSAIPLIAIAGVRLLQNQCFFICFTSILHLTGGGVGDRVHARKPQCPLAIPRTVVGYFARIIYIRVYIDFIYLFEDYNMFEEYKQLFDLGVLVEKSVHVYRCLRNLHQQIMFVICVWGEK